jgi:hypothetical protein
MARIARVVSPGVPHQLRQRGNRRQQTFFCDDDYSAYIELMAEWCTRNFLSKLEAALRRPMRRAKPGPKGPPSAPGR